MNIFFITSTRLGDAILSTGLLEYLIQQYPKAKITVACGALPQSIFVGFPNVDQVIPMRKEKFHGHWLKLWRQAKSTRWDMIIDLRDSIVSRILPAKEKYIFGKHIDKSLHKVEQNAATMKLSKIVPPKLYFTQQQQEFAHNLIGQDRPVIAVGPSANWIGKTWDKENFIQLIEWLTADDGLYPHASVAVFAAPGEEDQAQPVIDSVPQERQINGIAKGDPGQVAASLARCDFYIGNDSGLMHAAAAAGVKTFGVFGPSYPHLYRPYGDHCAYARTPETFDQLIDFDGYDPKTLTHSLMGSLSLEEVKSLVTECHKPS